MRQIFLDTETTGLYADKGDRIVEIGCVEMIQRKLTGNNRHIYVNPERDSHEDALRVHGITSEFLKDKPKFAEIAADLIAYLQGAEVLIHNAPFDVGFLDMEFGRQGLPRLANVAAGITDTLALAKELYPGKRNSLDALCDRLEVDKSGRALHGALLDAKLLADVFINMTRGQNVLLIDDNATLEAADDGLPSMDLRAFRLPVLHADAQELAQHMAVLAQIDKASKGKTIWRQLDAAAS